MASDILIVDDEADIRELISGILEDEGHSTRLAKDSDETLKAIEERRPSLVILDIWLQGSQARRARAARPHQEGASRSAGDDHQRPRQYRDGGGRDQARRLRLYREAVQGRPPGADHRARARGLATQDARTASFASEAAYSLRDDRQVGRHQSAAPGDRQGGADQQPRADHRPVGLRQGARGPGDAREIGRAPTGRSWC